MASDGSWYISIEAPFGGFAPAYWENTYASFGNRNQARSMRNIDTTDPTGLQQGPGLSTLTNGTEAGAVTTLMKHILPLPPSADTTYGIGGNKLYQISSTAVANAGIWPHTINKAAVTDEDGQSISVINGALYYFYNHSGGAGDIGKYDLVTTFDDDWGSTVPTAMSALVNAPHPSVAGNDNVIYFGNGRYAGYYDPDSDTLSADDFDIPVGSEVVDIRYLNSRVYVAVNTPNITGDNNSTAKIYIWGGVGFPSWDDFPNPTFYGKIGAIYPFGSRMFVWYQEIGYTGGYKLGYLSGNDIQEIAAYSGSLPNYAQVSDKNGMLKWVSDGRIHHWGAVDRNVPVSHSQYCDGGFSTVGALAAPFGTLMVASTQSTSFKLARLSGFDVDSNWKSLMYQVGPSMVDEVTVHYSIPVSGARVDFTLRSDQGLSSLALARQGETTGSISFSDAAQCRKVFNPNFAVQSEVGIELDYALGSTSASIKIRRIEIRGHRLSKQ